MISEQSAVSGQRSAVSGQRSAAITSVIQKLKAES
jgi:hypothetical protein